MRISVPTRFPPKYVILFIGLVFVGQEMEGTNIIFALLTALYNGLWATAYNTAGGLVYPSGAFILSNGLFSVVIGLSAKVLLLERGESNLTSPIKTMLCYTVGMTMMLIVCWLVRLLRPRRALIPAIDSLELMNRASIVCLGVGLVLAGTAGLGVNSAGSVSSALRQLGGFLPLSIVLATIYTIRKTDGRRSLNWVNRTGIATGILYGLVYFGKSGMLEGILIWGITAVLQGYNFKKSQILGLSTASIFFVYYLVPYSQYVRFLGSTQGSIRENIPVAIEYLSDLNRTRALYLESQSQADLDGPHLYDTDEGFLDRLVIIGIDDDLIHYTDQGNVFGLSPVVNAFANVVPHFIWPGKPIFNPGNAYAHELNLLPEDDETTGVAFSITVEAYHLATWFGVLFVMPLILFFCFIVFDSVTGSSKYSPFAVPLIVNLFNSGAAGGVGGPIGFATIGLVSLFATVWVAKVVTPFLFNTLRRASLPFQASRPGSDARPKTRPARPLPTPDSGPMPL